MKGHGLPPSKVSILDPTHPSLGFLALPWAQASSSLSNPWVTQVLLRQPTYTIFLNLCTPTSYWSNIEKVGIVYYATAARTTLNLGVFLCVAYTFLTIPFISLPEVFRSYPIRISKLRVGLIEHSIRWNVLLSRMAILWRWVLPTELVMQHSEHFA
jgi:hypothetical protein